MANTASQRTKAVLIGSLLVACGGAGADDGSENAAVAAPVIADTVVPTPEAATDAPALDATPIPVPPEEEQASPPAARARCSAPAGVTGAPRDAEQLVALLNALPRPTSLACFLESLERPLDVYLTRSELSLQPADGPRNPRTFLVRHELLLSVVPGGESSHLLEFSQVTALGRSIKGEIAFPLVRDVTASGIIERIQVGNVSICGGCHGAETRPDNAFFLDGAFESAVAVPISVYEVELESLRTENDDCDPLREASRCEVLRALFDGGEVRRTDLWAAD